MTDKLEDKEMWYVRVRQTQVFNHHSTSPNGTRDFNYHLFVDSEKEEEARNVAEKRYFWTAEKFADVYWEDGCPPARYFDLISQILSVNRTTFNKTDLVKFATLGTCKEIDGIQSYGVRRHQ